MTSFRDACAQPDLSLPEVPRVMNRSVAHAAGEEDFVTAVFAELDQGGWLQLVICGHPPPLRLAANGEPRALTPIGRPGQDAAAVMAAGQDTCLDASRWQSPDSTSQPGGRSLVDAGLTGGPVKYLASAGRDKRGEAWRFCVDA